MNALILVAAGSGQRLGAGVPKALVTVAGDSLIGHCLHTATRIRGLRQIVVVAPDEQVAAVNDDAGRRFGVQVVPGGQTRDASVRCGLDALRPDITHVLIHDAARPFTPAEVYVRVMSALAGGAVAVVPALAVADTLKMVEQGLVVRTIDRSEVVAVQTPQGFDVSALRAAHAGRSGEVTDDAMLMEGAGHPVRVVPGSDLAFKITTPFDLVVARALQEDA